MVQILVNKIIYRILYIPCLIKYFISLLISLFCSKKDIWLLCERGVDARDNAYFFFLFLKQYHPEINVYYIISDDSPDRKRLIKYEKYLIAYKSFRHYIYYCRAKVLISTHIYGFAPNVSIFVALNRRFHINKDKYTVSLKHGITKDFIPVIKYEYSKLDLLVCAAEPEFIYMKKMYGYPDRNLQYLGFCRFDRLHNLPPVKKQILVMPTWRTWLKNEDISQSDYLIKYKELLENDNFLMFTKEKGYEIVFYPHHEIQPYIHLFKNQNKYDHIIIADQSHYDVQELLIESAVLITDYSSVFFDFAYMKKPVIFYQFDIEKYRKGHYSKGYFDYEDSFGIVTYNLNDLIWQVKYLIENQCKMTTVNLKKIEEFFPLYDDNNCKRIYEYIYINKGKRPKMTY